MCEEITVNTVATCPYCGATVNDVELNFSQQHDGSISTTSLCVFDCYNGCHKEFAVEGTAAIKLTTYKIAKYE